MNSRAGLDEAVGEFYKNTKLHISFIPRREFQINGWSGYVTRHKSFKTTEEIKTSLHRNPPSGFFASTARYLDPGFKNAEKGKDSMTNKQFVCSDLAFDLDYTDLPGHESRDYMENLQLIADHTRRLIDKYLVQDLGINKDDLLISFSGGKGFHVRVPNMQHLDKYARTNLQEYISGHNVEPEAVFDIQRVERSMPVIRLRQSLNRSTYKGGWSGKVTATAWDFISELNEMSATEAVEAIKENWPRHKTGPKKGQKKNCANKTVQRMVTNIKNNMDKLVSGNITAALERNKSDIKNFTDLLMQKAIDEKGCAIDLSVTKDVKKQLRIPGSFHGGSGMPCVVITYFDLILIDSTLTIVRDKLGDDEVTFTLTKPIQHPVAGNFEVGEHKEPRWKAIMALTTERNSIR